MSLPLAAILSGFAVTGFVIFGGSAAQAADDDTVVYTDTGEETDEDVTASFTVVDPETLDETVLSDNPYLTNDDSIWLTGIEAADDGTGTAIRGVEGGEEDILTWDTTTGAQSAPVELNYSDANFFGDDVEVGLIETWSLDTAPDGSTLAIGFFDEDAGGGEGQYYAVSSVEPGTGVVAPIVDLTDALFSDTYWFQGLATDPTTNTTYLLGYHYESEATNQYPAIATPVDLTAHALGSPISLSSYPSQDIDDINEGDFDASGALYVLSHDGVLGRFSTPFGPTSTFTILGSPANLQNYVLAVTGGAVVPAADEDPISAVDDDGGATLAETGLEGTPLALGSLFALATGALFIAWARRLTVNS